MTPCRRTVRALVAMLGSRKPLGAEARDHVRSCLECRARYERIVAIERLAASGGRDCEAPSAFELARAGAIVLRETQRDTAAAHEAHWLRGSWMRPLLVAASLALVLAGALLALRPSEWTTRGSASRFAVRAFCRLPDGTIRSLADEPGPQESPACLTDGAALFAYLADAPGWVHVLSVDPKDRVRWLAPADGHGAPVRIERASQLAPLDVRLDPAMAGEHRVVFIEAERLLSAAEVERAMRETDSPEHLAHRLGARVRTLVVHFNPALPPTTP